MNIFQRDQIAVFGLYKTGTTALYSSIRQALRHSPRTLFEAERYDARPSDRERAVLAKVIVGLDNADYGSFSVFESWFTPEDIKILRPVLARFLDQYVYDADWCLDAHPRIAAEHASRYVERIVQRRRAVEGLQGRFP